MNSKERKRRIQRFMGVKPDDGIFGPVTLTELEKRLGIAEFAGTKLPPLQPVKPLLPGDGETQFSARTEKVLATLLEPAAIAMRGLLHIARPIAAAEGCTVEAISGTRTWAEQDALFAKGPNVTRARGGYSNHNFGIAIDLGCFQNGKYVDDKDGAKSSRIYKAIAAEAKRRKLPIEWGGDWRSFKDYPHFEFPTGYTPAQMRDRMGRGLAIV